MNIRAIERIEDHVRIIDQTRLPSEKVTRDITDYVDLIFAIKRLEVRGAPAIGIAAAYCLAMAAAETDAHSLKDITNLANQIKGARPTAVNLFWALDRLLKRIEAEYGVDVLF